MRNLSNNFFIVILTIVSCGDHKVDTVTLPAGLFKIEKVYDVGNASNASDIRASIQFSGAVAASKLNDVRFVVSKITQALSQAAADALQNGSFASIDVPNQTDVTEITFKAIGSLKDSDGDAITNGSYNAYIVIFDSGKAAQISSAAAFTLSNSHVLAGDYIGTWEDLGPPGPALFPMSIRIRSDYAGQMFYANAAFKPFGSGSEDAVTTMTVSNMTFSFNLKQSIAGYHGGCVAEKIITGHVEDDIRLVFDTFTWADCDGTRGVKLSFVKQ